MRASRVWGGVLVLAGAASCAPESGAPGAGASTTVEETPATRARIDRLRARFQVAGDVVGPSGERVPRVPEAVIGAGVVAGFERAGGGGLRPVVPPDARRRALRGATVELPALASGAARLEDETSRVAVSFTLEGAAEVPVQVAGGLALYPGAYQGADVVHRAHAEGTEDFVVFEARPAEEALRYAIDVSSVAGLRLVGNAVELLDEGGAPRLRVAPPYVVDARGERHEATLAIEGCAYDADPRGPWGRPVTAPGAASCAVRVTWSGVTYPAVVDPAWIATGAMVTARTLHTATMLGSGKVLVVGGSGNLATAELYDPGTGAFAATGSLATGRSSHAAILLGSGKVLVAGGYNAGSLASAQLYDPGTGAFAGTGPLATARSTPTATMLGSGKVLIAGGANAGALSSAEIYDPAGAGAFSGTGPLTTARVNHTATLLGSGKVLLAGGEGTSGYLSSAELFDPAGAGAFSATGPMAAARSQHTATLLGSGKVVLAGGYGSGSLSSAELFDPTGAGAFSATGPMGAARYHHTATLLGSGKVLVAGGNTAKPTELFDPTGAGAFSTTASLGTARSQHTATLLGSGKVLLAGGISGSTSLRSAELFDLAAAGAACATPDDCVSGACNNGVCCSAACSGACKRCAAGSGACVAVTSADDPDTCTGGLTCDAAGACKSKNGQPSTDPATCASGFASDGVCCATLCGNACDVCTTALGAPADGTCGPAPTGYAGSPACGNGLACHGANACPSACAADADCLPTHYCGPAGACQPRKAQGAACDQAAGADCLTAGCRDCASGSCVDGFCCDTACTGTCQACAAALKQSGTGDGTCGPARDLSDPHDQCAPDPSYPGNCKADGMCDGQGSCRLVAAPGTTCGTATCALGVVTGKLCNAGGVCGDATASCGLYLCEGGGKACASSCTLDAECAANAFCHTASGTCRLKGANAAACAKGTDCASGYCFDGVCCDQDCGGPCQACNVGANAGSCVHLTGDPSQHGRPACPGTGPCQGACDGTDVGQCHYPSSAKPCGDASCNGDVSTPASACDGAGECAPVPNKSCLPYGCDAPSGACKASCATTADCAQGATCDTATGKCGIAAGTCEDAFTVKSPDGHLVPCSPNRCKNGACEEQCETDADCADGYGCQGHACEKEAAGDAGAGGSGSGAQGGCGCRTAGAEERGGSAALLVFALLAARRRRRTTP